MFHSHPCIPACVHSEDKKGKNKGKKNKAAVGKQSKAATSEDGGDEDEDKEAEATRGRKAANRKKPALRVDSEDDSDYDIPPKRCAGNRKRGKPGAGKDKRDKNAKKKKKKKSSR